MPYDIIVGRGEGDKKLFGKRGLIFIGKTYVTMGNYTSLSNPIYMDVARSHVVLIAGKRGCLTGETKVFTDKGYKAIKEFNQKEDKVLSFNKDKKEYEWENAELLEYSIKDEELLELEFNNGRKIRLTREHPLLKAIDSNHQQKLIWEEAKNLRKEDLILSPKDEFNPLNNDLTSLKIVLIKEIRGIDKVYDLSVDKNHSFIANGIISHNSGKSYTLGGMAEAISTLDYEEAQNISSLIFDTMGIFWTMKFKNHKDKALLDEWGLEEKNIPVKIYVPFGYFNEFHDKGIPVDSEFAIKISDLEADDWVSLFQMKFTDAESVLIESVIFELKKKENYGFEEIRKLISKAENVSQDVKNSTSALFDAAESWKVFDEKSGTAIRDLVKGGQTTVIDLSMYASSGSFNVRALIIGLVSKRLFKERMSERRNEEIQAVQRSYNTLSFTLKREMPLVWIFIDEAHEFLPKEDKTPATEALIQLLREGRQPGISLVMATQQPGKIHTDAMTQSDIVISHRVTAEQDINSLNQIMQTYLYEGIKEKMNGLPHLKGSAILLDDNSERIYPIRVRPRFTWHGGEAPTAVRAEKIE